MGRPAYGRLGSPSVEERLWTVLARVSGNGAGNCSDRQKRGPERFSGHQDHQHPSQHGAVFLVREVFLEGFVELETGREFTA
jgi:hypothetical protein